MNRLVFFALLFTVVAGCSSDDGAKPQNPSWGTFTAKVNGAEWSQTYQGGYQVVQGLAGKSGTGIPCNEPFYMINTELYTEKGYMRQNLSLIKVPLVPGKYKIAPFINGKCNDSDPIYGILYTFIDHGDVSGDQYNILATEDNYLTVESYDAHSQEIKGAFQMTFVLERKGSDHSLPDTLEFTGGKFHTKTMDLRKK